MYLKKLAVSQNSIYSMHLLEILSKKTEYVILGDEYMGIIILKISSNRSVLEGFTHIIC